MHDIVDGSRGEVYLNPGQEDLIKYAGLQKSSEERWARFLQEAQLPALTPDGHEVYILANIEVAEEVEPALQAGATGIGLYRTNFCIWTKSICPQSKNTVTPTTRSLKVLIKSNLLFLEPSILAVTS